MPLNVISNGNPGFMGFLFEMTFLQISGDDEVADEIEGYVSKIVFHNEDNGYTVLSLHFFKLSFF